VAIFSSSLPSLSSVQFILLHSGFFLLFYLFESIRGRTFFCLFLISAIREIRGYFFSSLFLTTHHYPLTTLPICAFVVIILHYLAQTTNLTYFNILPRQLSLKNAKKIASLGKYHTKSIENG